MDESFREVLQNFILPRPGREEFIQSIIFLAVLVGAVILTVVIYNRVIRGREKKRFVRAAHRKGLTTGEMKMVRRLARLNTRVDPAQAFSSVRDFHRLFAPLMHQLAAAAPSDPAAREKLKAIFSLRRKLFGEVNYHFGPIASTVQLKIGQKVSIEFDWQGNHHQRNSVILDVDADAVSLANVSHEGEYFLFEKGHEIKVSFNRENDGQYEFVSKVVRDVEPGSKHFVFVAHSADIRRTQSRSYYRVPTSIPVQYRRFAWKEDLGSRYRRGVDELSELERGFALDIGAGGMMLMTEERLAVNDVLVFDLELGDGDRVKEIMGKVVSDESDSHSERFRAHVQFMNLSEAQKDTIARHVQKHDLKEGV